MIADNLTEEKLLKALRSSVEALDNYRKGQYRLAIGNIDHTEEALEAAKWIMINHVIDVEGKF